MKLFGSLAMVGILGLSALYATEYKVDPVHSTIGFKVRHMMVASVRGEFKNFSGHYNYDPIKKRISSLDGTVEVASVNTDDKQRDGHLRSKDFFDAKKYPQMHLKLIQHNGQKALVELTIKDVTKKIEFDVDYLSGESKDPWGVVKSGFELNGKVNRKDFNIMFSKLLETGGVAVGDEIKVNIELEGIKEQK